MLAKVASMDEQLNAMTIRVKKDDMQIFAIHWFKFKPKKASKIAQRFL